MSFRIARSCWGIINKVQLDPVAKKLKCSLVGVRAWLGLFVVVVSTLFSVAPLRADEAGWARASRIPRFVQTTRPPILIADQNRTVHAFSSQGEFEEDFGRVLFYNQWREESGWTRPVGIMLPFQSQMARLHSVYLSPDGYFHLTYFDGDDFLNADILYIRAPLALAGSAQGWSKPLSVGSHALTPDNSVIRGDGNGNLVVVYSGNLGVGNSVYYVLSHDNGQTWEDPKLLFSTYTTVEKAFDMDGYFGESGLFHFVWNVTNARGRNVAGYYSQLNALDGSGEWSEPQAIDRNIELGIAAMSIIENAGVVYLIYNNGIDDDNALLMWFRRSDDLGQTFSEPVHPFELQIGRNGPAAMVVDGNGLLHAFWGQRVRKGWDKNTDLHGMWHSMFKGGLWTEPEALISGPPAEDFDPGDARAVVVQGNTLLVTWRTDPGAGIPGVWYTYRPLEAPEAPLVPPPTAPAVATTHPTPTPFPVTPRSIPFGPPPTAQPVPEALAQVPQEKVRNPGLALLAGGTPVVILVVTLTLLQRRRRRKVYQ